MNDKELRSIVGNKPLKHDRWCLSIVLRLQQEHAFLLLEGIENGRHVAQKIDLKCKEGTDNTKAEIVSREVSVQELVTLGANCHSITWHLDATKREAFENLVEAEKERSQANLIDYITFGNSKVSGSVATSAQASGSEGSVNGSQASVQAKRMKIDQELAAMSAQQAGRWRKVLSYGSVESVDMLLRHGHNCYTWSVEVVKAIKLPYQEDFFKALVIRNPAAEIQGTNDGDEPSTQSHCIIF